MKQKEIIDTAIENFTQLTGWQIDIELTKNIIETDGKATLTHPDKKEKIKLLVDIKNELRAHDTFELLSRKRKEEYLIIVQYVSKPQRELLKANNINYLDSSGNCFIHNQNFFVFVDNQKVQEQRQSKTNKLFTEKGMRLVYALLLNNYLINATYRHISDEVGIALGTVGNLLNELEAEGFVKTQNNERQLKNQELLFEKWASIRTWMSGAVAGATIGGLCALAFDSLIHGTSNLMTWKGVMADVIVYALLSTLAGAVIGWYLGYKRK